MWDHCRQIVKSSLFANIINLFILRGFGYIIPILLIPFLINTIGIEKYGLVYFAIAFVFYFQVICEFGFDLSNVQHVIENKENSDKLSEITSAILINKFLIAITLFIFYIGIVLTVPKFKEYTLLYILTYIGIFGVILAPYWLFRSLENLKYITRIVLPIKTVIYLPLFFLVRNSDDYLYVTLSFILTDVISGIISLMVALRLYHLKIYVVPKKVLIYYLKDSAPFFMATLMTRLYSNSNMFVVGLVNGSFVAGIYAVSEKLYNAYSAVVAPLIQQIFYPYFIRIKNIARINKIVIGSGFVNIGFLFIIYFLSPYIVPLFVKESVTEILKYFNLFLLLLVIEVPTLFLGYPYLGAMKELRYVNKSAIFASLFHMCGLGILIILKLVSIRTVIVLLIITQTFCLMQRLYWIKRLRK